MHRFSLRFLNIGDVPLQDYLFFFKWQNIFCKEHRRKLIWLVWYVDIKYVS